MEKEKIEKRERESDERDKERERREGESWVNELIPHLIRNCGSLNKKLRMCVMLVLTMHCALWPNEHHLMANTTKSKLSTS